MIELRQLRAFVTTAELLHFGRAAERLHLAQPALSRQIRQLERQLGAALFERDQRSVRLTDAGAALLPEARATLAQAERAADAVAAAARGEVGVLRVGFLSTTANYLMPPVVRAFRERHPRIALRAEEMSIARLVGELRERRLDAGLSRPPLVDDLASETIMREPVAAVLPAGHPLAGRESLRLAELAAEPWVLTHRSAWPPWHRLYDEDFRRAGFTPNVVERGTSVQNLLALVAAGVGVTRLALSSRTLRHGGVAFVPLEGEEAETVVLWHPAADRPALAAFRAVVRDLARSDDLTRAG
jgi:DNA-binding transcriptional LysR family regulator